MTEYLIESLRGQGFKVITPKSIPPNDAAIAIGQAFVAAARLDKSLKLSY